MSRTRKTALLIALASGLLLIVLSVALFRSHPTGQQPSTPQTHTPVLRPTALPQTSTWIRIEKTTRPKGR